MSEKNSNKVHERKRLPVLQIGALELTKLSRKLTENEISSEKIHNLIDNMIYTCHLDIDKTAGLAAPQVGENVQLTVIRRVDLEESIDGQSDRSLTKDELWQELINPEIIEEDPNNEQSLIWEACLSIGEGSNQLWGPVWRPRRIKVKFLDRYGKEHILKADDFFSHLIQHEIDHLHGVLFTRYVKNPDKNLWLAKDFDEYLEKNGTYPPVK